MNFKLITGLSLFGLAMAYATVYFIPSKVEPFCWLPIFIVCAWCIGKYAPGKFFLHGFLVSLLNCIWITAVHIRLSDAYLARHAMEAAQYAKATQDYGFSVGKTMMLTAPVFGILSGLVLGSFSSIASRLQQR